MNKLIKPSIPYLSKQTIERYTKNFLSEYAHKNSLQLKPPIPIDDIAEKHLKLIIEFDDIHDLCKRPRPIHRDADILGALLYEDRLILIDKSIDPEKKPSKEGRYRFTLAHEVAHWNLHKSLLLDDTVLPLFEERDSEIFDYQTRQRKYPEEWQADCYAGCLLIPRQMVNTVWSEYFSCSILYFLQQEVSSERLEEALRPLAKRFLVSPQTLRIQLEYLASYPY